MLDYAIEKLTELMLMAKFKERHYDAKLSINKVTAYMDLIKLLKEIKENFKGSE